jgi:hypothetical protein
LCQPRKDSQAHRGLLIKAKQYYSDVWVGIPAGFTSGITAKVDGASCSVTNWSGRYLKLGALDSGKELVVTFEVIGHGNDQNMENDLTELEIWGSTGASETALTLNNLLASDNQSNVGRVKDGYTSTYWSAGGTGAWIQFDQQATTCPTSLHATCVSSVEPARSTTTSRSVR